MPSTPHADAATILRDLAAVGAERARRAAQPDLGARVQALKRYQQQRFRLTHGDLLASARYGAATRFFLDELYGPQDFNRRDAQFERIVPALVRLFPQTIVDTVGTLGELHALSESLDSAMAERLPSSEIDAARYVHAWQGTGRAANREQQLALTLQVGASLDHYTRRPMLTTSLRMMRGPAGAAGMSELQAFLEQGFDTFRAMNGSEEFLHLIDTRERVLMRLLFEADAGDPGVGAGQLP